MHPQIKVLREGYPLKLFSGGHFIRIQLGHYPNKGIGWERWVSKDKQNWTCLNGYLSLREVWALLQTYKNKEA